MPVTIATWNINSVRLREGLVTRLLHEEAPDILCLQECKSPVDKMPDFAEAGYGWRVARGQKGYNGVAILSRIPLEEVGHLDMCARGDARHVAARLPDGTVLHNFYVPAGGDVPDREANDKFAHKLDFVAELRRLLTKLRDTREGDLDESIRIFGPGASIAQDLEPESVIRRRHAEAAGLERSILVGDLNIAPREDDVWSHKQLLRVVSHTPVEVTALGDAQEAGGWIDVTRADIPDGRLYSWWSYRSPDWARADKGRRLDHIWASRDLAGAAGDSAVVARIRDTGRVTEDDLFRYGLELRGARSFWPILLTGLRAPEYTLRDALNVGRGAPRVPRLMRYDTGLFPLDPNVLSVDVPEYFFLGRHDLNTPSDLAAEYLGRLEAPEKEVVWFEQSAHFPFWREPDRFLQELLRVHARAEAYWRESTHTRSRP